MKSNGRNIQIEGLRGLSALMIVLYHVFPRYASLFLGQPQGWTKHIGSMGSSLFLLISAYFTEQSAFPDREIVRQ